MRYITLLLLLFVLAGCAGGPTHDYYSPVIVDGPRFKGPVTMALVTDVNSEKNKCLKEGYVVLGTSDYVGKYPEACELRAQARRAHANHVIYSVRDVTTPGSWQFNIGSWGGSGGTVRANETHIIFLGK